MSKIRIRAITLGMPLSELGNMTRDALEFYTLAESLFNAAGFDVQTRRMVFDPLDASMLEPQARVLATLERASLKASEAGVRWCCCPIDPGLAFSKSEIRKALIPIIQRLPNMFVHFLVTKGEQLQLGVLTDIARCFLDISKLSASGYDNFRVGAGCRIPPNTPFFPFSWHDGLPGFSIAVESISAWHHLATPEFSALPPAEKELLCVQQLGPIFRSIESVCHEIAQKTAFEYKGMDTSLAPFPDAGRSVTALIQKMAPERCGTPGTLAATALCTSILRRIIAEAQIKTAGFNGVMYSPLEDGGFSGLLGRDVDIHKLLLYSTVCGCGVDMVPLVGTTLPEDLASLIQDVAVLALRLNKPLGIRVLPIPGGRVNEMTTFNHDFLVNCRILALEGQGLMAGDTWTIQ